MWISDEVLESERNFPVFLSVTFWFEVSNIFNTLSNLTQFKSLKSLNISYNTLQNIKEIEQFTSLEYLDISGNPIQNYSPLYKLYKLKELKVSKNISIKEIDLLKSNLLGLKIEIE